MARVPKIRYTGRADTRIMSVDDFKAHGIAVPASFVWDRGNKYSVGTGGLSDEAVEFLRSQPDFEVR